MKASFEKLKKEFEKNPTSDGALELDQKLSSLNNSTDVIAKNLNPAFSKTFREYHLKIVEVRDARNELLACARKANSKENWSHVDPYLERVIKAVSDGTLRGVLSGKYQLCTDCRHYQQALGAIDQTSMVCESCAPVRTQGQVQDQKQNVFLNALVNTMRSAPVVDHPEAKDLRTQEVFKKTQEEKIKKDNEQKMIIQQQYKNTFSKSAEINEYVRDKYGFTHKGSSAEVLHADLMKENRSNAVKNYIYYSQRFSFSGVEDLLDNPKPKEALAAQIQQKMGSQREHWSGEKALPAQELSCLTEVGEASLREIKKTYKKTAKLTEVDVLNRLSDVLSLYRESDEGLKDLESMHSKSEYHDAQIAKEFKDDKVYSKVQQKREAAMEKAAKEEVGFLIDTPSFQKNIKLLSSKNPQYFGQQKKIIREALQETLTSSQKYMGWIDRHQGSRGAYDSKKDESDFSDDIDLLLYSSPEAIRKTLAERPYLMGRLCEPLRKAAKKTIAYKAPEGVKWGGGLMLMFGPPGEAFGTATLVVANQYAGAVNEKKIEDLKEKKDFASRGDDLKTTEAKENQKFAKESLSENIDEINATQKTESINTALTLGGIQGSKLLLKAAGPYFSRVLERVKSKYFSPGTRFANYMSELEKYGPKRIVIKPLVPDPNPPVTKWFGILEETAPRTMPWYKTIRKDVLQGQAVFRKITKKFNNGQSFDVVPRKAFYNAIGKKVMPGWTLTTPVRLVGGVVLFPLTAYGLMDRYLTKKEAKRQIEALDYAIENDYRLDDVKYRLHHEDPAIRITLEQARVEAQKHVHAYEYYSLIMSKLQEQGLDYDSPETTQYLLTDPEIAPIVSTLFKDVYLIVGKEAAFSERKDFFLPKDFNPSFEQVHELMKSNHETLIVSDQIAQYFKESGTVDPELKETIEADPFIQKLRVYQEKKQLTKDQALYWAMNDLEWRKKFKQWQIVDAYPKLFVGEQMTNDTLKLEDIRNEEFAEIEKQIRKHE